MEPPIFIVTLRVRDAAWRLALMPRYARHIRLRRHHATPLDVAGEYAYAAVLSLPMFAYARRARAVR